MRLKILVLYARIRYVYIYIYTYMKIEYFHGLTQQQMMIYFLFWKVAY